MILLPYLVVGIVVAVGGGHMRAVECVLVKVAVAVHRDSLVSVHGRRVGPERVHGVVTEHALQQEGNRAANRVNIKQTYQCRKATLCFFLRGRRRRSRHQCHWDHRIHQS